MHIKQFQPDEEGYMYVNNIVRPLGFGLQDHKPTFWAVVDPLSTESANAKLIVKSNGDVVGPELIPAYRATLVDEGQDVYHIFEELPKIATGQPSKGDIDGLIKQ